MHGGRCWRWQLQNVAPAGGVILGGHWIQPTLSNFRKLKSHSPASKNKKPCGRPLEISSLPSAAAGLPPLSLLSRVRNAISNLFCTTIAAVLRAGQIPPASWPRTGALGQLWKVQTSDNLDKPKEISEFLMGNGFLEANGDESDHGHIQLCYYPVTLGLSLHPREPRTSAASWSC
jgi:hypothetical protein